MPPPTSTGKTLARYSSIRPNAAASAARAAPPIAMSPSPGGSQPLDLLAKAARSQAGIALHRRQRGGEHHLRQRVPDRGHSSSASSSDGFWSAVSQYSIVS